jgi:hypothetical protein
METVGMIGMGPAALTTVNKELKEAGLEVKGDRNNRILASGNPAQGCFLDTSVTR